MHRQNLGEMLIAANLIDEVQMQIALAEQKQSGKRFGSTLVDLKFIDENVLAAFLSKQIDVPCISLLHVDIPKKVLRKLSRTTALDYKAVPVRMEGDHLEVAMVDPTDTEALEKLAAAVQMPVTPLIAPESSIRTMIERCYPEERDFDETISGRQRQPRNIPSDPVFWDIVAELESGDFDARLSRLEQKLDQVWVLLEKILRTMEREGASR
jgi:type II secretory ATPase GspE/PulE/Tfp pilus assembly ATPase PilB-like protein